MDESKQEALFHVACKQLSRSGLEALPTGPGAATAKRALARAASAPQHSLKRNKAGSVNAGHRAALRMLAGRGMSPVKEKRPTTLELFQRNV